ncbi:MAG: head-tail connector protein [Phycisphaerales bacterium]
MGTPSSSPSQSISSSTSSSASATESASPSVERDAEQVVTLAEAKLRLRVTNTNEDALIDSYIDAATEWAQVYQGRKYLTQTCVDYFDSWPSAIRPRWCPLIAVTSIQYIDESGVLQTLAADQYDVDVDKQPGRIVPAYDCDWPSIRGDINGIIVTYTAGYGSDEDDVPGYIRTAILLIVAHWYANREVVTDLSLAEIPYGAKTLLGLDRMGGV